MIQKIKTVRSLSKELVKLGIATEEFGVGDIQSGLRLPIVKEYGFDEETYGDESYVYLLCKDKTNATKIAKTLKSAGFKLKYQPLKYTNPTVTLHRLEIRVAYFRGTNWNE